MYVKIELLLNIFTPILHPCEKQQLFSWSVLISVRLNMEGLKRLVPLLNVQNGFKTCNKHFQVKRSVTQEQLEWNKIADELRKADDLVTNRRWAISLRLIKLLMNSNVLFIVEFLNKKYSLPIQTLKMLKTLVFNHTLWKEKWNLYSLLNCNLANQNV